MINSINSQECAGMTTVSQSAKLSTEYIGVPIIIGRSIGGVLLGMASKMRTRNG